MSKRKRGECRQYGQNCRVDFWMSVVMYMVVVGRWSVEAGDGEDSMEDQEKEHWQNTIERS